MTSRSLTVGMGLVLLLCARPAAAMGEADRFDLTALLLGAAPLPDTLSGLDRVAWELEKRTSVRAASHAPSIDARDPQLRRHPLLVLRGRGSLPPLDERSLDALRGHLEAGGLLFIDAADAERPVDDDPFDRDVRELTRRLFPRGQLEHVSREHVLWKTYYLVGAPVGRRARVPAIDGVSIDGRLAIIYSRNDVLGALARDRLGAFAAAVEPGGEAQREQALRLMINIVMYALCSDYKADQVHAPFLLAATKGAPLSPETALRLTIRPIAPGTIALALVIGMAAVLISAYALRALPPRRRVTLVALRALGMLCALLLFFQPALRRERRAVNPSRVVVLLDESASMSLPLGAGAGSRFDRERALAKEAAALADAPAGRSIELYAFGGGRDDTPVAVPPAALDAQAASGPRSPLGEALASLPHTLDRDLAAVIVLSDGADHGRGLDDGAIGEALRALGAPVHTITLGEAEPRDLVIGRVAHDDFAFVRTPIAFDVPITAFGAQAAGWVGRAVPVVLRRDGVVVEQQQLTLRAGTQHLSLRHIPDRVGEFVFDVSIAPQAGELTAANNLARFSLRVVRDRVRVLQVCGRPSWDERFLRSLFKRDPNVDLISFFILKTPSSLDLTSQDELALIPFPTDELFRESLHTFDLVVLQNFNYGPYQMAHYLPFIRRYVEEGGALAMLGGDLSFGVGGYAGTPIESILPVELDADVKRGGSGVDTRPVSPKLTAVGRTHPLTALALDVEESARQFAALPPLDGVNLVKRARPDASVLAVHPTLLDSDGQPLPIISVREAGRGRILAVGSDSTWRWHFEGDAHGARRPYERFWESAIRWLVRDPALSLLRLEIDRGALDARGVVPVRVNAVGPDYRPIGGAKVGFVLERVADPEGLVSATKLPAAPAEGTTSEHGTLDRLIEGLPEGAYRLTARATLGGRDVSDEKVFLVERSAGELADPAARPQAMKAIADATGGEARDAAQGVAGLPVRPPREIRVAASEDRPLWTSPLLLFLAVGAMCAAWALGRRWGRR